MDLIEPYGGTLCDRYLDEGATRELKAQARDYLAWDLMPRQVCDAELLLNGGFSPLTGFMGPADYAGVVENMRLADGTLWPIPVTLDVSEAFAEQVEEGSRIALRDAEGMLIAVMDVEYRWRPDRAREAQLVYGTRDTAHPGVNELMHRTGPVNLGGTLHGLEPPVHHDFRNYRYSPAELREYFQKLGWNRVVAFQTRNPMHRAQVELTRRAVRETEANLLIQPAVGVTAPGDVDHFVRVRCYEHVLRQAPEQTTQLSLLPLAMRMAGPREALWHAIIRRNYGCTHLIVGQDHASPDPGPGGQTFYGPYAAQDLIRRHADEIGIEMVPFQAMTYVQDRADFVPGNEVGEGEHALNLDNPEFRRRLREGLEIPEWFSYPEVVQELRRTFPPRHRQGFTVFFTGLSGSGKSTMANALGVKLMELGGRAVTLLDGDIVRKELSSELGFSKEHRDINVQRIGYVASEITKNGGCAICAPIAPYTDMRRRVRERIEQHGGFLEVHVATPLETCEARDRKGLYAKARAGLIKEFTGIDDPYQEPEHPELRIDTRDTTPDEAAHGILLKLEAMGFIRNP
ncbi:MULTISPECIES: bifunctional sulfate adenylyltransferase/adenylylsulfate kinase [unclassified Thioalkalivibrio]|uniref:bifunctional sulfate adenylyltransferase/adenylylsulfate kinase n=1 Tax=unclassified Thioalkalivibrio TaxID=2621013 RepID=UPI0003799862|nr:MULTISPECIES: bifunctional sulfate adenylyltransferase/adenylylsulfate kinase [unclassified Thioalkalivibrio]